MASDKGFPKKRGSANVLEKQVSCCSQNVVLACWKKTGKLQWLDKVLF